MPTLYQYRQVQPSLLTRGSPVASRFKPGPYLASIQQYFCTCLVSLTNYMACKMFVSTECAKLQDSPDMSSEFWKCRTKGFDVAEHFVQREKIKDNFRGMDVQRKVWYSLDMLQWNVQWEFKLSSEGLEVRRTNVRRGSNEFRVLWIPRLCHY